jgi:hypothetical protein
MLGDTSPRPAGERAGSAELERLIRTAFEQARQSGKSATEMNDAVLKNRILLLTDRRFSEADYGAQSFLGLLRSLSNVLEVAGDRPPYRVRLLPDTALHAAIHDVAPAPPLPNGVVDGSLELVRVRADLWSATVDYVSRRPFLWDPASKEVVRVGGTATVQLPTLTKEEFDTHRLDFARKHGDEAFARNWIAQRGGIRELPYRLRTEWTNYLKHLVIDRLTTWFEYNRLPQPADLLQPARVRATLEQSHANPTQIQHLRDTVLRIVAGMTDEELAALALPAAAVARYQRP